MKKIEAVVKPFKLVNSSVEHWEQDLYMFMDHGPIVGLRDPFFRRVAVPMWVAHQAMLDKTDPDRFEKAHEALSNCRASDWQLAAALRLRSGESSSRRPLRRTLLDLC